MKDLGVLKPTIRLSITNPASESGSVFGRGIANLCLGVREAGSLNAAAKGMGMAYSKAWRIVKDTEAALGIQLLDRDGLRASADNRPVFTFHTFAGEAYRLRLERKAQQSL